MHACTSHACAFTLHGAKRRLRTAANVCATGVSFARFEEGPWFSAGLGEGGGFVSLPGLPGLRRAVFI